MEVRCTLVLPNDAASIPAVRHLLGSTMRCLGIDGESIDEVEIAVTEACTNVLRHATGGSQEYEVEIGISNNLATINISDRGAGFDSQSLVPAEVLAESGRGIMLMHALVDEVHFSAGDDVGTVVTLTKQLNPSKDAMLLRLVTGDEARPGRAHLAPATGPR